MHQNEMFKEKNGFQLKNMFMVLFIYLIHKLKGYINADTETMLYYNIIMQTIGISTIMSSITKTVIKSYLQLFIKYMPQWLSFDKYAFIANYRTVLYDNVDKYDSVLFKVLKDKLKRLEKKRLDFILNDEYEGNIKALNVYFNYVSVFKIHTKKKNITDENINNLIKEIDEILKDHTDEVKHSIYNNVLIPYISILSNKKMKNTEIIKSFDTLKEEGTVDIKRVGPNILYLIGEPGVGKTNTIVSIIKVLQKYFNINYHKVTEEEELTCNGRTNYGNYGEDEHFMDHKINMITKMVHEVCKNNNDGGIIFIDELDKIINKKNFEKINKNLTLMLQDTNEHYDEYLKIFVDKSNVLFILAGNRSLIEINENFEPLTSRIIELKINNLTFDKKKLIMNKKYDELINNLQLNVQLEELKFISNNLCIYPHFPGVREPIRILSTIANNVKNCIIFHNSSYKYDPIAQLKNDLKQLDIDFVDTLEPLDILIVKKSISKDSDDEVEEIDYDSDDD